MSGTRDETTGMGALTISLMTEMFRLGKGRSPVSISKRTTPSDHRSVR
jgi:hypothetical protein